jgi:hypothetical protein
LIFFHGFPAGVWARFVLRARPKQARGFNALAAASQPPMGYRGDLTAFMIEWRNRPHACENTAGKKYLSCSEACALV